MGHATGEAAYGIHFLRLAQLLFQLTPVSDVFDHQLQDFLRVVASDGGAATEPHDDDATVLAFPLHFDAIQSFVAAAVFGEPVQLLRIDKDFVPSIQLEKLFDRSPPQHFDQGGIDVEECAPDRATADAEGGAQNYR